MKPHEIKIGVIGSTTHFIRTAQDLAVEMEMDLETAQSGLNEAIPLGLAMERNGVEVMVSRRGTAFLLREKLTIPVLSVPVTAYEVFQSIQQARQWGRRILVPTHRIPIDGLERLQDVFGVELLCRTFYHSDELEEIIQWGQRQGYEVVIGGGVSIALARNYGLQGVEIRTSKSAMTSTLEDARAVAFQRREELSVSQRYRTIIDTSGEGIIAVDRQGNITTINRRARAVLDVPDGTGWSAHVRHYPPLAAILEVMNNGAPRTHQVEKIGADHYVMNYVPVKLNDKVVGGITTFQDISNLMLAETEVRRTLSRRLTAKYTIEDFVHNQWETRELIQRTKRYALTDSTVLILGDTGTGKEILAHALHNLSRRRKGPFVSINCGALPEQLLESELFGYEEGAFTGSRRGGKAGLFEMAHNGTIFLDEIGGTPLSLQSRLLRVLQEREVMRIGGDRLIPVNVRVLAAANKDLNQEVAAGRFREDLFFRLNVLHFRIPPLRERTEDLPLLMKALIRRLARQHRLPPVEIPEPGLERLCCLPWPGNVRQLSNFAEHLIVLSHGEFNQSLFDELCTDLMEYSLTSEQDDRAPEASMSDYVKSKTRRNETRMIREALEKSGNNKTLAARRLGISRTSLWRKMKALGLN